MSIWLGVWWPLQPCLAVWGCVLALQACVQHQLLCEEGLEGWTTPQRHDGSSCVHGLCGR